jgi:CubicO group peptidase (beta-lactamase class C family)
MNITINAKDRSMIGLIKLFLRYPIIQALIFLFSGCVEKAEVPYQLSDKQIDLFQDISTTFPLNSQLSLAILNGDKVNFFGIIFKEDTFDVVNNQDSVFEIGSITKILTSTMLARFLIDEKILLDEPIERFLPFKMKNIENQKHDITFRHLANHTSGLPRMPGNFAFYPESSHDGKTYSLSTLQEYLENDLMLISTPGEDYNYSNLGYGILGYVLSKISGEDYETLLNKMIRKPYKLRSTTTQINKIRNKLVLGQNLHGQTIENYGLGILNPSGGVYSNVSDLAMLVHANFGTDTLLAYQRQETYGWGNFGVALGWHILKIGGSNCSWYYHSGGMEGYRSSLYMDVISKKAVIILSNISTFHPHADRIDQLASDLLKNEYMKSAHRTACVAPFIELALEKGWGARERDSISTIKFPDNSLYGVWTRVNDRWRSTRTFFPDHRFQTHFQGNEEIDVWGYYRLQDDQIVFTDIGGAACVSDGIYRYEIQKDTLRFYEIEDNCSGRELGLVDNWVRMTNTGQELTSRDLNN